MIFLASVSESLGSGITSPGSLQSLSDDAWTGVAACLLAFFFASLCRSYENEKVIVIVMVRICGPFLPKFGLNITQ